MVEFNFLLNTKPIVFDTFSNGEIRINVDSVENAAENYTGDAWVVEWKYQNNDDFFKLALLKDTLDELLQLQQPIISLCIYYMPYSRMDRKMSLLSMSLKTATNLINSLNFNSVYLLDAHSDVTPALLNNSSDMLSRIDYVDKNNTYSLNTLLNDYHAKVFKEENFDEHVDTILYPDFGAQKRATTTYKNELVAMKKRNLDTGKIIHFELFGEIPTEGRIFIIDDLCSYGNTFVNIAKALIEKGFPKEQLVLVVTHAENGILLGDIADYFPTVHITDSFFQEEWLLQPDAKMTKENLKITNYFKK